MLTPMCLAKCVCGWQSRFVAKDDARLFANDFHAADKHDDPHPFEGTLTPYREERPVGKRLK